jgi:YVTN family beta-propeller protein
MLDLIRHALHRPLVVLACTLVAAFGAQAAAPKAYVGNFKDNSVSVIDTASAKVVATIPVVAGPHGMAIGTDGRFAYVSGEAAGAVSVIDTQTDSVAATVEVGATPHGLAMQPDGALLLVGVYGDDRVAFVDTASRKVVAGVAVAKPHTIAIRPDGRVAYVASQQPGQFALVVIDLASRAVTKTIALEKPPRDLEFASDGQALYYTLAGINALQVLDPATQQVVAQIPTGASPHLATQFKGAAVGTAVVQGPGELMLFEPAKRNVLRSIAVGKQPHWMASGDGKTVYVTNEGSNDVTAVDLASGSTKTIPVGNAPRKVVVQPGSGGDKSAAVSINNFAFNPGDIVISEHQSVSWRNDDGSPHALAFNDGAKPSDLMLPGASFSRRYDKAGSYAYVCSVHPYMTGKVIVKTP